MAKYSYEFEKEIVMAYINGEGEKQHISNKYEVKSSQNIMSWTADYLLRYQV